MDWPESGLLTESALSGLSADVVAPADGMSGESVLALSMLSVPVGEVPAAGVGLSNE